MTHPEIEVKFINQQTGDVFMKSLMPVDQLPDSFDIDTSLTVQDKQWAVVKAEPAAKEDFSQTVALEITLAEIEYMDPNEIHYSLPSISNCIAEVDESTQSTENTLIIHEDDWRNVEFVSAEYIPQITDNLNEIMVIHQENPLEYGFRDIHLREEPQEPLQGIPLTLSELIEAFGDVKSFDGVSYKGTSNKLKNSFAFETPGGINFYGITGEDKSIEALCIKCILRKGDILHDINSIKDICLKYVLCVVDWCHVFCTHAEGENFDLFFTSAIEEA